MRAKIAAWAVGVTFLLVARQAVDAQLPTTVQLPTFSFFSVDTSVVVPDSGGAYSEAARRARLRWRRGSSIGRGAGQGGGAAVRGGGLGLSATIHPDTDARNSAVNAPRDRFAADLAHARRSSAGTGAVSVAQARARFAVEEAARQHEAQQFVAKAQAALAQHKPGAAKVYLQMAARRAKGDLQRQVSEHLKQLAAGTTPSR